MAVSNPYLDVDGLKSRMDERIVDELSSDDGTTSGDTGDVEAILDDTAGELESNLAGRYGLPLLDNDDNIPSVIKWYIATKAARRLWLRRGNLPQGVDEESKQADAWLERVMNRQAGIPNLDRQSIPELTSSGRKDGQSRFDGMPFFGMQSGRATETSTAKGKQGFGKFGF